MATRRAGLVAGLAVALYPPLIANDVVPLSEPVSLVLILGLVLALGRRRVVLAGVLCGLLVLARPSAQGVALVVGAWLIWQLGPKRCAQFLMVTGLVIAPWVVRNWVQLGSPVLVTSNGFNEAAMYSPAARQNGAFVDPVCNPAFDRSAWPSSTRSAGSATSSTWPSTRCASTRARSRGSWCATPRPSSS